MQKHFTKDVCHQVFGTDPCWWNNYTCCCDGNMTHFYGTIGGKYRDALNGWAVGIMLNAEAAREKESQDKAIAEAEAALAKAQITNEDDEDDEKPVKPWIP